MLELIGTCAATIEPGTGTQALTEWQQPWVSGCWLVHSSGVCWMPNAWMCTEQPWSWAWCMGAQGIIVIPGSRVLTSPLQQLCVRCAKWPQSQGVWCGHIQSDSSLGYGFWPACSRFGCGAWNTGTWEAAAGPESGAQTNVECCRARMGSICVHRGTLWSGSEIRHTGSGAYARQHNLSSSWGSAVASPSQGVFSSYGCWLPQWQSC